MGKIIGFPKADILRGLEEHDEIWGFGRADKLWGGSGSDTLWGGDGDDRLYGGRGADVLIGGTGADLINGGFGFDWVSYTDAKEAVTINLSAGPQGGWAEGDTLINIEAVVGSRYNDILIGNQEANTLNGGAGNDRLDGASGNDLLIAGAGQDTLLGGEGTDTFCFYISTKNSHAVIEDFEIGRDVVEVNFEGLELIEGIAPMSVMDGSGVRLLLGGGSTIDLLGVTVQDLYGTDWLSMTNWEPYLI